MDGPGGGAWETAPHVAALMNWDLARLAVERGCELILASDAHAVPHLEFDAFACAIASRAEVPPERVLNRMTADVFGDWLEMRD